MRNLGAKEAADAIRGVVEKDHMQRVDPTRAHQIRYVTQVCAELGLEASADNVNHVAAVLREHDIDLHAGHEYPKWVGKGDAARIVNDAEEERLFLSPPPPPAPEPTDTAAPVGDEYKHGGELVDRDQVHVEEFADDEPAAEAPADPKPARKRPM